MLLGCIGDDFTGSSDLGNTLTRAGMRTVQYVGVPGAPAAADVEAGIVALKSRSVPVDEAVRLSLEALDWLRAQGCRQFLFKYCSTFDSTPQGNIGPVAEALADALGARKVLVCPAFPGAGRTIYQGHLFVGDRLLNESGMENHPLTPMRDADIRRWLALQTKGSVGHVPAADVFAGAQAVSDRLTAEDAAGHGLVVADAIRDEDLMTLGRAAAGLPLLTGGSGIAMGLPNNFRAQGLLAGGASAWRGQDGRAAALSGSCSNATRAQVARHRQDNPALEITAEAVMAGEITGEGVAAGAGRPAAGLFLGRPGGRGPRAGALRDRGHRPPAGGALCRGRAAPGGGWRHPADHRGRRDLGRGGRGAGARPSPDRPRDRPRRAGDARP